MKKIENLRRIGKTMAAGMLLGLLCLSGCSQETPLSSLASNTLSTQYDFHFWANEAQNNTVLWQQAKAYCNQPDNASTINCQHFVESVEISANAAAYIQS